MLLILAVSMVLKGKTHLITKKGIITIYCLHLSLHSVISLVAVDMQNDTLDSVQPLLQVFAMCNYILTNVGPGINQK